MIKIMTSILFIVTLLGVTANVFADLIDDPEEDLSAPSAPLKDPPPASPPGLIHDDDGLTPKAPTKQKTDPSATSSSASPVPKGAADGKPSEHPKKSDHSDKPERNRNADAPINFESDELSGDRDGGTLVLDKNVVVTQDDLKIMADKATMTMEKATNEVVEVVAVGNVRFYRKDPDLKQMVTATSKEAVFHNAKRTVVLKGDPKMVRGTDVVRGKQIIYDLNTGWVKATRVEGVVQPAKTEAKKPAPEKAVPTATTPAPSTEGASIEK